MHNDLLFSQLMTLLKEFSSSTINIPPFGSQKAYEVRSPTDSKQIFKLIINRCGNKNGTYLTILIRSNSFPGSQLMRLDFSGIIHSGVETPHVHFFDTSHEKGKVAIPLSELTNPDYLQGIIDVLTWFMGYNRIDNTNVCLRESLV